MPIEPKTANLLMEMATYDIAEVTHAAVALTDTAQTCAAAGNCDCPSSGFLGQLAA
jgi:hypothetical protein